MEPKYECLFKNREDAIIKSLNDPNAFTEFTASIDVYNNVDDYNSSRKRKVLTVFNEMITDIMANKKPLFIRCRKIDISLEFITQPYFLF